MARVEREATGT
jgi:hypothetical protein